MSIIKQSGLKNKNAFNELEYWRSKGGTGGTVNDAMISYLGSQGYTGTPHDMLAKWLSIQAGNKGTIKDNAKAYFG